jgi:hypothetical protein
VYLFALKVCIVLEEWLKVLEALEAANATNWGLNNISAAVS